MIKPHQFGFFIGEIFDRFLIQSRINRARIRLGIGSVHFTANNGSPIAGFHRKDAIANDGDRNHQNIGRAKIIKENPRIKGKFKNHWQG